MAIEGKLISIRKSVENLERIEHLQQVTAASYAMAVRSTAEYAVELNASDAEQFRRSIHALYKTLESGLTEADLEAVQSSFRGELRAYHDRAAEWLARRKEDLRSTEEAMKSLARDLSASGSGHEKRLQRDLDALTAAADTNDLAQVQAAVRAGVASITQSYAQLRNENLLMAAQLHEEIRLLHRAVDAERKAAYTDAATGAWNRKKCDQRLDELLGFAEAFCVVIVWVSNLNHVQISASRSSLDDALKALVKRAASICGGDAAIGRWSDDEFMIILEADLPTGTMISGELARQLSTRYTIQEQGGCQHVLLRVNTVLVDRAADGEPDRFRQRLEQVSTVLRGA